MQRTVGGEVREGPAVSPYAYEHYVRGELALARGDLAEAALELDEARAGGRDDPYVLARLADVLDRLEQPARAQELLDEAEQLDPEAEVVWLTRGRLAERHDRLDEAEAAYAEASAAAPESSDGPLALAAVLRRRDREAEADAVLDRFVERAEGGADASRAQLAAAVARGDADGAERALRALLEVAPARGEEVRAAARLALAAERPELALRLFEATPAGPEDRTDRLRAALAARDADRAEGILALWGPEGAEELLLAGRAYLALGRAEDAVALFEVADRAGAGSEARRWLGAALRAQGELARSAEVLGAISPGAAAYQAARRELALTLQAAGLRGLADEVAARAR